MLISKELTYTPSSVLNELSQTISNNVHSDFYCVEHIKKGLIYLHGKLPDLVKEYLEHKFSLTNELKYMVANSVILEGVNLPIDNLYILNTYALDGKSLTNLIGRVNRLNEVFDDNNGSLSKLLPPIHFVNSDQFNRKDGKMEHQIRLLKNGAFKDNIENPLLLNFNLEKMTDDLDLVRESSNLDDLDKSNKLEQKISNLEYLRSKEHFLIHNDGIESSRVKHTLMESGISSVYNNPELVFDLLESRLKVISSTEEWGASDVIDKVYLYFIKTLEDQVSDTAFLRLQHPKARDFYKLFTRNLHRLNLKDHISQTVAFFHSVKFTVSGKEFFIGNSYGEIAKNRADGAHGNNVYIDLSKKTDKELVNLALVKIKIESDFVSYRLNEYVKALHDLRLITENEYNLHIYGTTKKANADFVKMGISGSLVNKLERDNQTINISITALGGVSYNNIFLDYVKSQDDLFQFEIRKYIDIQ